MRTTCLMIIAIPLTAMLALLHPSPAGAQGPIASGETLTGTISPVGDSDTWTLSANTGDAVVVRIGEITQSGNFTPQIRLYSPSMALLATAGGAVAAEIAVTAASTGTFTVIVDDALNTATGTYRLTLAQTGTAVVVSPGDEGGPLTNGAMHTGTIDVGDLDVWTVSATAGDAIVARMGEVTNGSTLTPWVRIYSPTGVRVESISSVAAAEAAVTAGTTGTYLVVAGDGTNGLGGSGAYRLTLAQTGTAVVVSPGDEGGPLTNGAMHTGTIDVGDLDVWTVSATAGDAIVARMGEVTGGSTLTPWVRIYSPAGVRLGSISSVAAAEVAATAGATGTYLVVVGDGTNGIGGSGAYRLTLAQTGAAVVVSPGDEGGPLTNGAMHTGTIDVGDLDVWMVSATAGDAIVARMGEVTGGSTLTPWVRIYSPAGVRLGSISSVAAAEVAATAGATGTYLVVVGDGTNGIGGSGAYRLTLAQTGAAVVVSPGDEGGPMPNLLCRAFISVGDLDVWTLTANVGATVVVTMEEATSGSPLTPSLRLYSPTGALLASNFGAALAQVSTTAPATGTYLVVAGDGNNGLYGLGTYWLRPAASTDVPGTPSPSVLALAPGIPNPFATRSVLRYRVPVAESVALRVFDAEGRLVRTLVDERSMPAGEYEATWDGRNASGKNVGPGLYLARLESGGRRVVQKVVLSR